MSKLKFICPLGVGGQGVVVKAELNGNQFAVKMAIPPINMLLPKKFPHSKINIGSKTLQSHKASLLREVLIMQQLGQSESIIGLSFVIYTPYSPFNTSTGVEAIVYELAACSMQDTLVTHVVNKRSLSLSTMQKWVFGIAEGLAYIHAKRIIHRDIKLENMLLSSD